MNTLEFIAALASALAWPVAAVMLAWIFKPTLTNLIERLRSLKYGGVEAGLEALDRLGASSLDAGKTETGDREAGLSLTPPVDAALAKMIEIAPATAIEDAWRRLRSAIGAAAYTLTNEQGLGFANSLEVLLRDAVINTQDVFLVNALSSIRQATYYEGASLPPAAALDFVVQADNIARKVTSATEPPQPEDRTSA